MPVQRRAPRPEDLAAVVIVSDGQISPDGGAVAFVRTDIDTRTDEYRSTIWVAATGGGDPVQLTRGGRLGLHDGRPPVGRHDTAPRWSPDGRTLAFLSDRDGATQLYLLPLAGGEPRRVTALHRGAGPAVWAPDCGRIAFRAEVDAHDDVRRGGAAADSGTPPEDRAADASRPRVVTRAQYKGDGFGYTFGRRHQLFVLTPADGRVAQLTHEDVEHAGPAWSPDGRRLAFVRARGGAGDYSLFDLWTMDAAGGDARQLTREIGRAVAPAWSPDGAWIACFGADEQEAGFGDPTARVWLVPPAGGPPRRLTAGYDRAAVLARPHEVSAPPIWSADGRTVSFLAADAGRVHAVRAAVPDGTVVTVIGGDRQIQSVTAAADRLAFTATDPTIPADLFVCAADGSAERRLTRVNDAWLSEVMLPRVEHRRFSSPHGGELDGWVTHPVDGRRPAPLLLEIHGGPASYAGPVFPVGLWHTYILAAQGWAILQLNPIGSGSYTKSFAHGIRGCWGERDLPEQLAAVDALVAEGTADAGRLGVAGYSYGGFMTSWTITHTDRFAAAVVGAPVVNLESFHGTSDIGPWFGAWEMRGDVVTQRETYRRLSPINYVERATTPTLIVHGEADDRCPIGQGEELFAGLVTAGRAPVEFVRYPGQSHGFRATGRPSHRMDVVRRVVDWMARYVRPSE